METVFVGVGAGVLLSLLFDRSSLGFCRIKGDADFASLSLFFLRCLLELLLVLVLTPTCLLLGQLLFLAGVAVARGIALALELAKAPRPVIGT